MAVTQPARTAPARPAKGKTKAKQRYLKAKKVRRKAKKAAGPKPFGEGKKKAKPKGPNPAEEMELEASVAQASHGDASESESESSTDTTSKSSDSASDSESSSSSSASSESVADRARAASPSTDVIDADPLQAASPAEPAEMQDDEPQYLFRFPRPQQTSTSDAQQLASLGLPQGLERPTFVDASHTQSLDTQDEGMTEHMGVRVSRSIKRQLDRLGISEWFAVQASVIPLLLSQHTESRLYMPFNPPRDLCISAPTGSGKTLAYTVPIVELLQTRIVTQLRALVLLPTRDLAVQVAEMFEAVGRGSGLRSLVITGNHSFRHEQAQLVSSGPAGFTSNVDVLIATPGRLVDHVRGTPGFTLQHLRFLVIDEADRLLGQSFQQWVPTLLEALQPQASEQASSAPASLHTQLPPWMHDDLDTPVPTVQKLLFSATLTRDPAKMNALQLRNPHYVSVRDRAEGDDVHVDRFALPAGLHEHMIVTETSTKVLFLLYLLHSHLQVRHALCFTKSVESANRLVRLLAFFEKRMPPGQALCVQYYSSDLTNAERAQMLRRFQQGEVDVLVCSDLIARGIDLPEVRNVISYDVPVDMAKYVHRVGRTARAGRSGDAWSLVEEQEVFHFKRMLREAHHLDAVQTVKVKPAEYEPFLPSYKEALAELANVYSQQRGM
ncbi:RNA helicase [Malassezia brasiliensis]|uniref:ATP-dependent RNA helicase n=1 Tax=Malassezia brasiliensis TaxID=1821822 RepID=A0AAF0IPC2_9BASI|nr:RNA helicase [Malassezia brasiliensis]